MGAVFTLSVEGVIGVTDAVAQAVRRDPGRPRKLGDSLADACPVGSVLTGPEGWAIADALVTRIGSLLPRLIEEEDPLLLFSALRHISPGLWRRSPELHNACRSVAELAVHSGGAWGTRPNYDDLWTFTPRTIEVAADLVAGATAMVTALALRRRVAKGQTVKVARLAPIVFIPDKSDDIDRLVDVRDRRVREDPNDFARVSGLSIELDPADHNHRILAASWVAPDEFDPAVGEQASAARGELPALPEEVARQGSELTLTTEIASSQQSTTPCGSRSASGSRPSTPSLRRSQRRSCDGQVPPHCRITDGR